MCKCAEEYKQKLNGESEKGTKIIAGLWPVDVVGKDEKVFYIRNILETHITDLKSEMFRINYCPNCGEKY